MRIRTREESESPDEGPWVGYWTEWDDPVGFIEDEVFIIGFGRVTDEHDGEAFYGLDLELDNEALESLRDLCITMLQWKEED